MPTHSILMALLISLQAWSALAGQEWTARQVAKIGTLDGDVAFSPIVDIEVHENQLYVSQLYEYSVWVLTTDGELVQRIGRAGQGPGEFEHVGQLGWRADTLWVLSRNNIIYLSSSDGRELRRVSFGTRQGAESGIYGSFPLQPLADGTILGEVRYHPDAAYEGRITEIPILRHRADGSVIQRIASVPTPDFVGLSLRNDDRVVAMPDLVQARPPGFAVTGSGDAVITVVPNNNQPSPSFALIGIGLDGDTLFARTIAYDPQPITNEWKVETLRLWAERIATNPFSDATATTLRAALEKAVDFPRYHPPVGRIVGGGDETIWLEREPAGAERVWEVYSDRGRLLGRLRLPRGFLLHHASRRQVWGVITDQYDVPYIVGYEITNTISPRP